MLRIAKLALIYTCCNKNNIIFRNGTNTSKLKGVTRLHFLTQLWKTAHKLFLLYKYTISYTHEQQCKMYIRPTMVLWAWQGSFSAILLSWAHTLSHFDCTKFIMQTFQWISSALLFSIILLLKTLSLTQWMMILLNACLIFPAQNLWLSNKQLNHTWTLKFHNAVDTSLLRLYLPLFLLPDCQLRSLEVQAVFCLFPQQLLSVLCLEVRLKQNRGRNAFMHHDWKRRSESRG